MQYNELAKMYEALENVSSRLEKTKILSTFIKHCTDFKRVMLLLQGRVFPPGDEREVGMASQLVVKAIVVASGKNKEDVVKSWKKTGDLGETAQTILEKKSQNTLFSLRLTTKKVFDNLQKLASMEGQGMVNRKVKITAELLSQATPLEAKYVVRTILEDLRTGVGESTIRDALVWAFVMDVQYDGTALHVDRDEYNKAVEAVQHAYDVSNDFGRVAESLQKKGLQGLKTTILRIGIPLKVMLYQKAKDIRDGFKQVGKPAAIEYKIDGFRMQIHKKNDVKIFTRRMENVTKQFPDVVKLCKHIKGEGLIIDAEAVGLVNNHYVPFQQVSQRIKRKHAIDAMAKQLPVCVCVFDILAYNNESLLDVPFQERRALLEKVVKTEKHFRLVEQLVTSDQKKAELFYKKSLQEGHEGVMMKSLDSAYKPGSRVGFGVKIKPVMDTLECVIVGADWGEGKRSEWLASFTLAIREGDEFKEIGKLGTGIKEKKEEEGVSFSELTTRLKPLILEEKGKHVVVKPKIVVEVEYEEIQKSPTYASGYALRFPRFVRLRDDRNEKDVANTQEVEALFKNQRGR